MRQESSDIQPIELTEEMSSLEGVRFDQTKVRLTGSYSDELSMFRAKRTWNDVLGDNFLLESNYDFQFSYIADPEAGSFVLHCEFITACGRYAFWRLTNNQAPEAQYIIETAHIPNGELRYPDFLKAPDLSSIESGPLVESHFDDVVYQRSQARAAGIRAALKRILTAIRASVIKRG